MSTKKIDIAIICLSIITVLAMLLNAFKAGCTYGNEYVAGEDGNYCYVVGQSPKTIDNPIYFDSLHDCEQYINKKF